ncbi:hypothetical protein [Deinococcus aquaedulcis]|uniref:hypothetical protein n=1 Tax=Deinococcus aquaedulcis TaxID=2840455 RepID=UPI001C82B8CA|nr:hypothetical protein [Deinococcus aquaedulcis]
MTRPDAAAPPAAEPDSTSATIARAVQHSLEAERRDLPTQAELERRTRELRYREAVDQRWLRLGVGAIVFLLSAGWLAADIVLTLAVGWGQLGGRAFKLDSTVVVAFLTTSTATVIGLFLVFLRWLYPQGAAPPGGA